VGDLTSESSLARAPGLQLRVPLRRAGVGLDEDEIRRVNVEELTCLKARRRHPLEPLHPLRTTDVTATRRCGDRRELQRHRFRNWYSPRTARRRGGVPPRRRDRARVDSVILAPGHRLRTSLVEWAAGSPAAIARRQHVLVDRRARRGRAGLHRQHSSTARSSRPARSRAGQAFKRAVVPAWT